LRLTDAATLAMDRRDRDALAVQWRRASAQEYACARAFADLACRLRRRGAPADLVARCESMADLGLDGARRCLELASRFAGHDISLDHLRRRPCRPMRRASALARLARDASALRLPADWYAAWLTDQRTRRPRDVDVRTVVEFLAADHGRQDVCDAVVAWCSPASGRVLQDLARLQG
jgi:hypothetical protein